MSFSHRGANICCDRRGEALLNFSDGDRVIIPAGVWHRHGAVEAETFIHLAVTMGETEWECHGPCE